MNKQTIRIKYFTDKIEKLTILMGSPTGSTFVLLMIFV